jgi:hypothetical protein
VEKVLCDGRELPFESLVQTSDDFVFPAHRFSFSFPTSYYARPRFGSSFLGGGTLVASYDNAMKMVAWSAGTALADAPGPRQPAGTV